MSKKIENFHVLNEYIQSSCRHIYGTNNEQWETENIKI